MQNQEQQVLRRTSLLLSHISSSTDLSPSASMYSSDVSSSNKQNKFIDETTWQHVTKNILLERRPLFDGSDIFVSPLGYGASGLGGVYGHSDLKDQIASVHLSSAYGVNYFDTAPFYGANKSEEVLGLALRDLNRSDFVVATKVGRYGNTDGKSSGAGGYFDFSATKTEQSVKESCVRLGVNSIDLIQMHDVEYADPNIVLNECLPMLLSLKSKGLVRAIGINGYPLGMFTSFIEQAVKQNMRIDTILSYAHYTPQNTLINDLTSLIQTHKMGLINASVMGLGLLTPQGAPNWHPAPATAKKAAQQAVTLCQKYNETLPQLCLKFALTQPHVNVTVMGACTTQEVKQNLACVGRLPRPDLLAQVQQLFVQVDQFNRPFPAQASSNPVFKW